MKHGATEPQRQANAIAGQDLTRGFLSPFLRVSLYNGDQDGADLLCEKPGTDLSRATRARVQAKFLIAGNSANIDPSYAEINGIPRRDFFLIVHVNNGGTIRSYFLTAADVLQLPRDKKRGATFSGPKGKNHLKFLVSSWEAVASKILEGVEAVDKHENSKYISEFLLPLQMRGASNSREQEVEYVLTHVQLPRISEDEEDERLPIVIARSKRSSVVRVIDARWDLFPSTATWAWGYRGQGPKLTAWSILGHFLGGVLPTRQQFDLFLENCIAQIKTEGDAIIEAEQIERAICAALPAVPVPQ